MKLPADSVISETSASVLSDFVNKELDTLHEGGWQNYLRKGIADFKPTQKHQFSARLR